MSRRPIARSPDLKRLRDEGYDVDIVEGHLVVRNVPYANERREVKRGVLISTLVLSDDITSPPDTHVIMFSGEYPCHSDGRPIERIRNGAPNQKIGNLVANFTFSAKPKPSDHYDDYYKKIVTYADILGGPAQDIEPGVTAKTFPLVRADEGESVFLYEDTASSRAEITEVSKKLRLNNVAIGGVGGTGSYILDLVAKTPVAEIHLFDGDVFYQHNAFRAPGAASGDELAERLPKVSYFKRIYEKMRRGIIAHAEYLTKDNVHLLKGFDFVFLCMEGGSKREVVEALERFGIPFIDVGMGVYHADGSLGGILRTVTSTNSKRSHVRQKRRIPFSDNSEKNEYDQNIQIADLNALHAALAVIKWKKLFGFYLDQEREFFSTYSIGGNDTNNEDNDEE